GAVTLDGFQDRCLKPLSHSSATGRTITALEFLVKHENAQVMIKSPNQRLFVLFFNAMMKTSTDYRFACRYFREVIKVKKGKTPFAYVASSLLFCSRSIIFR
ncbi:hypothetical protein, partial [Hafnia paralvei]|uniref:hypothetical protein n=1 Tax=Hafnia paralvei TaxID=546367 RepID=UPI0027B8FFF0